MKRLIPILIVCLILTVVPALGQETVSLRVMSWSVEQADFYELVVAEFEAENPGIDVTWETLEQSAYREALPLMFQSDDAPDIFFWIGANRVLTVNELLGQGWIAPVAPEGTDLTEWLTRWPEGSFVEGINLVDGVPYSFPFNDNLIWGPGYMYMNTTVFADAGLDVNDPPQTWTELLETCRTIVETTGVYCLSVPLTGNQFQRTWYALAGTAMTDQFFDYQSGRFAIDDPRLLATFDYIQTFFEEELAVPGFNDQTFARAAIANGQAAIYMDGAWMPSVFRTSFEFNDFAVAPTPYPDEGRTGSMAQTMSENKFFVSSQTEHPEEAWLFIEFMTRPDGIFAQEYLRQSFGTLAYADNGALIEDPVFQDLIEIAATGVRVMYPEPALACPDVAQSQAYINAENIRRNWEFEEMSLALSEGREFAEVAADIAAQKNAMFQETLEAEAAEGLDISVDCYTFADWNPLENFDISSLIDQ